MATDKQISANWRNAARSSGPNSAEGTVEGAGRALAHGLAGHGVIPTGEMADQIQDRMGHWRTSFRPDGPAQEWLYIRICTESVRADHGLHRVIARRDEAARRASESWDDDRALEALELGATISRKPELVRPRLLRSKHGALWLLAQWEELERRHDLNGDWTASATSRAMDLLGLAIDAREGAWKALTGDNPGAVRALVREQIGAIRDRLGAYLETRDDRARSDAEAGLADDGPDVRRALRDEGEALRRLRAWTRDLQRLQGTSSRPTDRGGRHAANDPSGPDPARSAPVPSDVEAPGVSGSFRPFDGDRTGIPAAVPSPDARCNAPEPSSRTSPVAGAPVPPLNRHARRASAALARRDRRA